MARLDYWRQSLEEILPDHGVNLPTPTIEAIAKDLVVCAEMESEASGHSAIPNPLQAEIQKLKEAREQDRRDSERRDEIYRKDIAYRISPRTDPGQVGIQDGRVEIWRR